ncbi:hypothetical protein M011DRAFT_455538 [Sporormia fimetaria CBS 119925]|uniref:Uncharacterized protein n=1 Tax=Sporormia fimetaria CBS 119925 TaxID=1340428 RepID=A0A6A6VNZ7_9PLEO|nr:hypothetical protein M011DRAFT_455538 [Sporormia fimetaria CBS 119925]
MPLMPRPLFSRTPRPDLEASAQVEGTPASQAWRFSNLHTNVRSIINGSSVYSNSPKTPWPSVFRRPQSPPPPITIPNNNELQNARSPLQPLHTAGSYLRTIGPFQTPRAPAPVHDPLPHSTQPDVEAQPIAFDVPRRKKRRHHRRKHHRQHTHWVRRKQPPRTLREGFTGTRAARSKLYACLISGLFLAAVLAVYLALALTRRVLSQEIHVLFIMIILAITIFFSHSLIRLFMLAVHPPHEDTPKIPETTGPEGFNPIHPIRVHVARDEELGASDNDDDDGEFDFEFSNGEWEKEKKKSPPPPPPAYGLWRESVRVDPNLLHWARVEPANAVNATPALHTSRFSNTPLRSGLNTNHDALSRLTGADAEPPSTTVAVQEDLGPRPPSYVSEDGVSYIVDAAPRSTVNALASAPAPAPAAAAARQSRTGVSDIHPAWRPGYAISEIRPGEFGLGLQGPTRI